jgi:hypothetical protein
VVFEGTFTLFFKDKKSKRVTKSGSGSISLTSGSEIQLYSNFFFRKRMEEKMKETDEDHMPTRRSFSIKQLPYLINYVLG